MRQRGAKRLLRLGLAVTLACGPAVGVHAQSGQLPDDVVPRRYRIEITPDAGARSFRGAADIDVDIGRATARIVLNSADLVIDVARLDGEASPPAVRYDVAAERASLVFPHRLSAGARTLHVEYHGRIFEHASGLFVLESPTDGGKWGALFTQFENSDARRFVPCWDEPGRKAVFELAAKVPAALAAYSNMPVAATQELRGGLKRVQFAASPRMSPYLLFFALGDFERIQRTVEGVDVGVVFRRGDAARAAYALEIAAQVLPYYDEYFGFPYPLPKLDIVVGPGVSQFFDAMENWGAIFGFDRAILFDPRVSTEADRQRVYEVVAHEMAHQWFGDLVTMAWWDDLWLNEAYADWMQKKVMDHFHPEWKVWLRGMNASQAAMSEDARAGTHPIIVHVVGPAQASTEFDSITYDKGSAVIRTLESYLGEETFREGVRAYMRAHAYGNTRTDDLWQAIDGNSPRPITRIAHDLTLQAGVPMISERELRCVDGRSQITLAQGRFAVDEEAGQARLWHVPVLLASLDGALAHVLVAGAAPTRAEVPGCAPVVINSRQSAYYRSRYSRAGFGALLAHFAELAPEDQAGLLYDSSALAFAGFAPVANFMELTRVLRPAADPAVVSTLVDELRRLDAACRGLPLQEALRGYERRLLAPMLERVGWDAQPGESDNLGILRADLLEALGQFGDPAVLAESRRRFEAFRADPASLDASARGSALHVVALNADPTTWDQLHGLARAAATPLERVELYDLLANAQDPVLARRALDLALSDEPPVTTGPEMIAETAALHSALAFDFARAHWETIAGRLETESRAQYVPHLLRTAWDTRLIAPLEEFARTHIPPSARREVLKASARVRYLAALRQARLPELARWLATADR